jgi:mono/diheme cytochrome c family protein
MRILGRIAVGLIAIIVLALVVLYAGSEWKMRRGHDVPLANVAIRRDAASIVEGARLAKITGCRDCHGANGGGQVLLENPMIGTIAAPALARVTAAYSDAELVRAIRHGVHKDGSALYVMPTNAHAFLADEDVGRIVAWIRSLKARPDDSLATTSVGPMARGLILSGQLPSSVHPATVSAPTRSADKGKYFVSVICAACHALHEPQPAHDGNQIVPALAPIAAAYDPAAFRTLIRTGVGPSRRDLGLMKVVSINGLQALTDEEIAAIQAYLTVEAAKAPAQ